MCSLFRNKYRVESCRLKGHDYLSGGKYFITICTQGKTTSFGIILNQQMVLSESGQIAMKLWYDLPAHFSFVTLDEFVVMPDHIHGIVIIHPIADSGSGVGRDVACNVSTSIGCNIPKCNGPTRNMKNDFMASISPKPGSLATVIRSYKSVVSKNIHKQKPDFSWQPRYYDHLIRSDQELNRIRKYIINNPGKWEDATEAMEESELR